MKPFIILLALTFTWWAAEPVLFRERWTRARMEYLRERFGRSSIDDLENEESVERHREEIVPVYLAISAVLWLMVAL